MIVLFDMDGTLTKRDTLLPFVIFLCKNGQIRCFFVFFMALLFKLKCMSLNAYKKSVVFIVFYKQKKSKMRYLCQKWLKESALYLFRKDTCKLVKQHLNNNDDMLLVSASVDCLVAVIAQYLGFKEFIATPLQCYQDRYTGFIQGEFIYGEQKKYVCEQRFGALLKTAKSYADHPSDRYLMESVKYPVWV